MKVGVDARLLSRPITGIGRYTMEMCRALSKIEEVSLHLYSPAAVRADVATGFETANIRTKDWDNGLLRQIWSETYLPLWIKKDAVDVFWGPAHRLPHWLPPNIARVVTIHDLVWKYASDTMRPLSRLLEKSQMPFAVKNADHVVADTRATASAVVNEFHITPAKLSVITLGASKVSSVTDMQGLHSMGINQPYFLFVGTLEPRKNLHRLLLAYASLPDDVKTQAKFVIAGGKGWGYVDLQDMIARLGIGKYVSLLGYVDEHTLAALYANAQFLAMPSLYEGFGLPLIEAMVYGTPALTSNNSSMPEVAGDAGFLIDAHNVESIANGLIKLITDEKIRDSLAAKAKNNAAKFNWDESAQQLIIVFKKAISARNSCLL
ncbi:MAG: glycosyltransferase family 4 protein [Nitrosomonas sp.]|nr:glycosyltransferase family 4 protein [Nitrosomonas sp.]